MRESVSFFSEGCRLQADLYLPDELRPGAARPGIVLCHGYTGVKDIYLPETAAALNAAGFVALAFDYKGWGESQGPPARLAPHGRVMDARAALTFLALRAEVDQERMGLFGWSYGGSTAIWLAATDPRAKCVVSAVGVGDGERWMRGVREAGEWAALVERSEADLDSRVLSGESGLAPRPDILRLDPESARISGRLRRASAGSVDHIPLEFVDETLAFNPEWVVDRIAPRAVLLIAADNTLVDTQYEIRISTAITAGNVHDI